MKTRFFMITVIALATFALPLLGFDQAYALCVAENEINWNTTLDESELVFVGTVTRLDNYDGPQKVTFFIHDVIKGEINTPKYILENYGLMFLGNDTIASSSISVEYTIGKTYKVYVMNGDTRQCTTKTTTPPADYMWEPGPEDGNYYSENPEYVDPCDEGYGLSDDVCITLEEMNRDNPICNPNPKHDFGKCNKVYEESDNMLQDVLDNCNCQESDQSCIEPELRWWNMTHYIDNLDCDFLDKTQGSSTYGQIINPKNYPEPKPEEQICRVGDELVDGVCIVSNPQPVYGLDCEVLYIWNYAIDDCNFRINSIDFIFSLLLLVSIVTVVSILIVMKYKKRF